MALKLTDQESADLVRRTKKLMEILADAWDPSAGKTAEVSNKHLEEADRLDKRWRQVEWVRDA